MISHRPVRVTRHPATRTTLLASLTLFAAASLSGAQAPRADSGVRISRVGIGWARSSVNTVVFRDGRTIGHNTDWSGFARAFDRGLRDAALDRVVLLGAGGAGAAVAHALLTLGTARLTVLDVDLRRALGRAANRLTAPSSRSRRSPPSLPPAPSIRSRSAVSGVLS